MKSICIIAQEINPESHGICLSEMLIKNQDVKNIQEQGTLLKDCFTNQKMRFVIENPPSQW